ncbi:MAG TPA: hypothetical protein VH184_08375 [Dongiaceae bacterium]|jgi:hypothetical protein|nr:hypothetical protein [Dongiaceae bacterium]
MRTRSTVGRVQRSRPAAPSPADLDAGVFAYAKAGFGDYPGMTCPIIRDPADY